MRSWGARRKSRGAEESAGTEQEGLRGGFGWGHGHGCHVSAVVAMRQGNRRHRSLVGHGRVGLQGTGELANISVAGTNGNKGSPPPVPGHPLAFRREDPGRAVLRGIVGLRVQRRLLFPSLLIVIIIALSLSSLMMRSDCNLHVLELKQNFLPLS